MAESTVQVSPSGGGPNVRTLSITQLEADGTYATVQQQVIAIADDKGKLLDLDFSETLIKMLYMEQRVLATLFLILQALGHGSSAGRVSGDLHVIDEMATEFAL